MENYFKMWSEKQQDRGIDVEWVKNKLSTFTVETPSWGYSDSGTRFQVFKQQGAAKDLFERLSDASQVHKFTGICPTVAVHIPWDKVDDFAKANDYAKELGVSIGAINPNLFQDNEYKYGSICNADAASRDKAVSHMIECVDIARETDSKLLSLWFADGTNYPGQGSFRDRKNWMFESLKRVYDVLDEDMRMLIEYKFFEPAFYHTDLADWGCSYLMSSKLGEKAQVLVDMGHHPQGTNVEHIVALLLDEAKIGGFHFNNRKYADDDLMVGAIDPFQLYLVFVELVSGGMDPKTAKTAENIAYMIDQCHNLEAKIPGMIQSVINIQTAYAKALLVNYDRLKIARNNNDVLGAQAEITDAYETDVRPVLSVVREEMGLNPNPIKAFKESGYEEKMLSR